MCFYPLYQQVEKLEVVNKKWVRVQLAPDAQYSHAGSVRIVFTDITAVFEINKTLVFLLTGLHSSY